MKITSLKIEPEHSWKMPGETNPMLATVKMTDRNETQLQVQVPSEMMKPLLDLLTPVLVQAAQRQMEQFTTIAAAGQTLELEATPSP